MIAAWAILRRFLLSLTRVRANLLWMLVLPIVFVFVFGVLPTLGSSKTAIAVVDEDHSQVSQAIVQQLQQLPDYNVKVIPSADAQTILRELKASVVVTLPPGLQAQILLGRDPTVDWVLSPNSNGYGNDGGGLLQLRQKLSQWITFGGLYLQQAKFHGATGTQILEAFQTDMHQTNQISPLIQVHNVSLSEGQVQTKFVTDSQRVMMGFATMFIVFTVFASTGSLFLEREKGTWNRVKASPANKASILAGYGLGFFAIGWLQFLILYLAGRLLFGIVIPLNAIAIILMSLYVLAICGIALTVAGSVKSNEQHMMIGSFVGISTSMIGGAYWPLEIEPTWMQHLAWFVPQSWALSGFKAAALGLSSMTSIGLPLAVLAGFAVIFFGVGMVQLRYS